MQRDTSTPKTIIEHDTGRRWKLWTGRAGLRLYFSAGIESGRAPSSFFSHSGNLKSDYYAGT